MTQPQKPLVDANRVAFESAVENHYAYIETATGIPFNRWTIDNCYLNTAVQGAWIGWQAREQAPPPRAASVDDTSGQHTDLKEMSDQMFIVALKCAVNPMGENLMRKLCLEAANRMEVPSQASVDERDYIASMIEKHADRADMFMPETEVIETRWVQLFDSAALSQPQAGEVVEQLTGYVHGLLEDMAHAYSDKVNSMAFAKEFVEKILPVIDALRVNTAMQPPVGGWMDVLKLASDNLKAVMCDPEGNVCVRGSDGDIAVMQKALADIDGLLTIPSGGGA